MYYIKNVFAAQGAGEPWAAVVVGCGGTGSYVAEGLARLLDKDAQIILVDHDRVEERNIVRQNFSPKEIGEVKSAALAKRLSERYNRPIGYSTLPIQMTTLKRRGILLGCVDNGIARAAIAEKVRGFFWWVDAGNGYNYGQILIGNSDRAVFTKDNKIDDLPLPSIQRPEILSQAPAIPQPNCIDVPDQGPTINQVMAVMMVEVVRRMTEGTCPWIQLLIDMEHGSTLPVLATPPVVSEIMHTRSRKKILVEAKNAQES